MLTVFASRRHVFLGLLTFVTTIGIPLQAQQLSVIRPGSFEIGPFLGASYGIDETRVMGGGNVTFAINKYILPYVEYSYLPGIGRDVTEVRALQAQLAEQATRDPLTGLANRRLLDELLGRALRRAERSGTPPRQFVGRGLLTY